MALDPVARPGLLFPYFISRFLALCSSPCPAPNVASASPAAILVIGLLRRVTVGDDAQGQGQGQGTLVLSSMSAVKWILRAFSSPELHRLSALPRCLAEEHVGWIRVLLQVTRDLRHAPRP